MNTVFPSLAFITEYRELTLLGAVCVWIVYYKWISSRYKNKK